MTDDNSAFPAEIYKETVLAPLFEQAKRQGAGALMRIHVAHAVMLAEQGILRPYEASAILRALAEIEAAFAPDRLTYTGAVEDFFFHIEGELAKRLGGDLAGKLHTGRSRNDIDHTVFKMGLKDELARLLDDLTGLIETLISVAEANFETIVVAYTHGQPAQPTTFGHYLAALIEVLLRDADRLLHAGRALDLCSMGAAAITTTGFPIDRARMAELLGFGAVQENSYGCIAACDYVTGVYANMKVAFINLGRFVQDLNQWTGFEVGHIHVPDAYVQISSIMPQKRNPVPVEHLRLLCSLTIGHCDTVTGAMHNTPFTDMNDSESEVQAAGHAAFGTGARALRLLRGLIGAISIDEAQVRRHIEASCITITELADTLVRVEDISFRQAHAIAGALVRRMIAHAKTPATVAFSAFAEVFAASLGRRPKITEEAFRRTLTPENFIAVRTPFGGPAPVALRASLERYKVALGGYAEAVTAMRRQAAEADGLRTEAAAAMIASPTP